MEDEQPAYTKERVDLAANKITVEIPLLSPKNDAPRDGVKVETHEVVDRSATEESVKGKAVQQPHPHAEYIAPKEDNFSAKNPPAKQKMDLLNLPYDLKSLILSYITRPADMKNLCLVNKEIQDIIIRQLYRRIDLDIGGVTDSRLSAFLRGDNPGLKHIREVNLWLYEEEEGATLQQANYTMRLLIDLLPANTLEGFNWHEYGRFSSENFILLCKRQKRLKYIQANPMDKPILHQLQRQPSILGDLKEADDLGLFPTNVEELEICQMMVQNAASRLRELMICPSLTEQPDLNDGASEPGKITRTIFKHMLPFKTCTALRLKTLWLENVNLRYSIKTYMKVIDFPVLEFLDIRSCKGAEGLLQGMTRAISHRGSKLMEFRLNHKIDSEQSAVSALEDFLYSFQGLEILLVVLDSSDPDVSGQLPKSSAIVQHKGTLHTLLSVVRGDSVLYNHVDFRSITTSCDRLEQLSIAFPEIDLLKTYHSDEIVEFNEWISLVHEMPQLITLNITTWPAIAGVAHASIPFEVYEHLAQRLAQSILAPPPSNSPPSSPILASAIDDPINTLPTPPPSFPNAPTTPRKKLSVVAFGISEKGNRSLVPQVSDDVRQMIFWYGSMQGAFGPSDQAPLAIPMKWRPLKYAEPDTGVLEYRHV